MIKSFIIHSAFDFLAVISAFIGGWAAYIWQFRPALKLTAAKLEKGYFLSLCIGSIAGAYFLGTLNLYISGISEIGRSILGSVCGATLMVEAYKFKKGISGSTGYIYIVPFCLCVVIGRLGCLFSGINDHTYGTATDLAWGWDYGDHIPRHPVQIYESLSVFIFLILSIIIMKYNNQFVIKYGYYFCMGFYALQRFMWEFLKPYQPLVGPLNIFHFVCIILFVYSMAMTWKIKNADRAA
jgi:prolipoprotein diacylglyceryltransferase